MHHLIISPLLRVFHSGKLINYSRFCDRILHIIQNRPLNWWWAFSLGNFDTTFGHKANFPQCVPDSCRYALVRCVSNCPLANHLNSLLKKVHTNICSGRETDERARTGRDRTEWLREGRLAEMLCFISGISSTRECKSANGGGISSGLFWNITRATRPVADLARKT